MKFSSLLAFYCFTTLFICTPLAAEAGTISICKPMSNGISCSNSNSGGGSSGSTTTITITNNTTITQNGTSYTFTGEGIAISINGGAPQSVASFTIDPNKHLTMTQSNGKTSTPINLSAVTAPGISISATNTAQSQTVSQR